jgi:acetylornithine deacetylase/succinyl-diaminopimelate desuccinylase-like protein
MQDDLVEKALGWFKELLRIDSSNPPGNEKEAATFIARILEEHGISSTTVYDHSPTRTNLVAAVKGSATEEPLLLSSHVDVVPVEDPSRWTVPPFSGIERDGMVWGRGALDVKYKTAFDLAAIIRAKKKGTSRTLKMIALADEEEDARQGSRFMVSKHLPLIQASHVLNEVGGFNVEIGGQWFLPIQTGEKSIYRLRFTASGVSTHASFPVKENSLALLGKILQALSAGSFGYHLTQSSREFFTGLSSKVSSPTKELFGAMCIPGAADAALEKIPDPMLQAQLRAMLFNTVTPTIVKGGFRWNVVPESCVLECDVRAMPEFSPDELKGKVDSHLRSSLGQEFHRVQMELVNTSTGYEIPSSDPCFKLLKGSIESHWKERLVGATALPMLMPASSDNSHYFKGGIKPVGFAPLFFPKGFQGFSLAHGVDERVPVESFKEGLLCYFCAIDSLNGSR